MNSVVVGPGRLGRVLVHALPRAGHRVVGIAGGHEESRATLQREVAGLRTFDDVAAALAPDVDLVVLTVPDDAIADVVDDLARRDAWSPGQHVVHTSGAHGLAPLRRAALSGCRVAACHPAQTVPEGATVDALVGAMWAVTAADADRGWASALVTDLGGDAVVVADRDRALYHAGLVIGSNAVGAAVASARQLLLAAGIEDPARFLGPLVDASVRGSLERGAVALTGPIVRGDVGTIASHLEVLDRDVPLLASVYRDLGRAVLSQVRPMLDPAVAAALAASLAEDPTRPDTCDD